jgi:hypothetical protein
MSKEALQAFSNDWVDVDYLVEVFGQGTVAPQLVAESIVSRNFFRLTCLL